MSPARILYLRRVYLKECRHPSGKPANNDWHYKVILMLLFIAALVCFAIGLTSCF